LGQKSIKRNTHSQAYQNHGNHFVRIFRNVRRGVVFIRTDQYNNDDFYNPEFLYFFPRERVTTQVLGTGFVIRKNGLILTSEHVVTNPRQVTVKLYSGKQYSGSVIWSDSSHDIAIVKIEPVQPLFPLPFGSSRNSKVGEIVMSIGNPLGLEHSITTGVISGKHNSLSISDKNIDDIIQTDCAINPGNSGGPLINLNGQVIGMNAFVAKNQQGLGFALGADGIKKRIQRYLI
jgi:serine protease Do